MQGSRQTVSRVHLAAREGFRGFPKRHIPTETTSHLKGRVTDIHGADRVHSEFVFSNRDGNTIGIDAINAALPEYRPGRQEIDGPLRSEHRPISQENP